MIAILKSFEHVAMRLSPTVLVLPGLVATALGLFIWLGGLGFRRWLLGAAGMLVGVFGALCAVGEQLAIGILAGLLGSFVAVVFQRFFAAVLLGGLVGGAVFLVAVWSCFEPQQGTLAGQLSSEEGGQTLTVSESLDAVRMYAFDLKDAVRRAAARMVAGQWAIVVAATFALLFFGWLFRHLGGAMACSLLGTVMIFGGLVLLLMFKGSDPIAHIETRAAFFGMVFLAMVTFGTLEQWILYRRVQQQKGLAGAAEKSGSRKADGKRSWRDR